MAAIGVRYNGTVLAATLLALGAAVLHAGWNLAVKQSSVDRFLALWGQFLVAGLVATVGLVVVGGIPASGLPWAAVTGVVHVPYCVFLARAYRRSDFSLVYPVARGGGALLAGIGGVALLGDHLSAWGFAALVVVAAGLVTLAGRATWSVLADALAVAVSIGVYSVADAEGVRVTHTPAYALATFAAIGVAVSAYGLACGQGPALVAAARTNWRRFVVIGLCTELTYSMVVLAFRSAPVGYVTALRESSVVLAAFIGWRLLHERTGPRRVAAAGTVLGGLVLLVVSR